MKIKDTTFRNGFALCLIAVTAIWRVLMSHELTTIPEFSNFSPVGAMALFGGAYFARWNSFIVPVAALWLSDIVLNKLVFYGEWVLFYEGAAWTYGAFVLMALAGNVLMKDRTALNFAGGSLVVVFIHWIVTDIGVWLYSNTYPQTLEGFIACLIAAIPFERNLLFGTLFYGTFLFVGYEWMSAKYFQLKAQKVEA
jgi:hypothetical protein